MRILRAFATVSGFTAVSRIFGLVRENLISTFLGAGAITDIFVTAFRFPNFFRRIFAEGAFNVSFVPLLSRKLTSEGKEAAHDFAEQAFSILFFVLFAFVTLVVMFTPQIIHLLVPGYSGNPELLETAVTFIRLSFPYILFVSLAAHLSGVLNTFDRFAAAAGVPILLNIVMIASLVFSPQLGYPQGLSLTASITIAGILQFAWLYGACRRMGVRIHLRWPKLTPDVKQLLKLMGPAVIGAGTMNINLLIDTALASFLPTKSITYIFYADRLNQLPLSIIGIAIGTALLPTLSRELKAGDYGRALKNKLLATEAALQLSIPAAIGLGVLSLPIISLIYCNLPLEDIKCVALALSAFAIGIPAYVLNKVFITGFFARQDTKTPVKIGIGCIVLNFLCNIILMKSLGHVALALSTSISAWANALVLYYFLKKRDWFAITSDLAMTVVKICGVASIMGYALWAFDNNFAPQDGGFFAYFLHVGASVAIGLSVFGGLSLLFKTIDLKRFREALGR